MIVTRLARVPWLNAASALGVVSREVCWGQGAANTNDSGHMLDKNNPSSLAYGHEQGLTADGRYNTICTPENTHDQRLWVNNIVSWQFTSLLWQPPSINCVTMDITASPNSTVTMEKQKTTGYCNWCSATASGRVSSLS